MSIEKQHINAYVLIGVVVIAAFVIPFIDLPPLLMTAALVILFTAIVFSVSPLMGLLLLLIIRPILDYFTNDALLEIGSITVNVAVLLSIVVLIAGGSLLLKNWKRIRSIPLIWQWSVFLFFVCLSLFNSVNLSVSISEIARILTIVSLFFLGYFIINSTTRLQLLVNVLLISAIIPVLAAFAQFSNNSGLSLSFEDVSNRLFGTFSHPNLFAFYLVFILGLLLYKFLRKKKNDQKLFWLIGIGTLLFLLIQTYTRGAWIAFVIIVLIAGTFQYRKMLVLSIGIFVALYALFSPIQERINSSLSSDQSSSVQWRYIMWQDSIEYAKERPILGFGAGTTEMVIKSKRGKEFESNAAHNDLIKIALEYGIGGLASFVVLLGSLLAYSVNIFRRLNKASTSRTLVLAFLAISASLIVSSLFDNIIDTTALQWIWWTLAGSIFSVFPPKK
ncbi:MAG: O-antigen ligase family protein [Patescibacteria group bacterium]|nr:O-antigen ligase family protein [Patescibacteria group bacterium]